MSLETSELNQPSDGDDSAGRHRFGFRHADTGVDEDGVDRDVVDQDAADDEVDTDDDPQPTFTPADNESDTTLDPADGQVVQGEVVEVTTTDADYEPATVDDATVPATDTLPVSDAVPASTATAPPVAAFDENAPLLGDSVTLKASWQQAAAEFVDDPRAAVAEAAELVERTAQTLVGALQQRERQLRGQWETGTTTGANGSNGSTGTVDTEELRHLMQSYRALFNQLCAL
jgi:hypothetical protein